MVDAKDRLRLFMMVGSGLEEGSPTGVDEDFRLILGSKLFDVVSSPMEKCYQGRGREKGCESVSKAGSRLGRVTDNLYSMHSDRKVQR